MTQPDTSFGADVRLVQETPVPKGEPFYIRQHGAFDKLTREQRLQWWDDCAKEAKKEGAVEGRYSVDNADNPTMALVEAWNYKETNQGDIRWQMTTKNR